MALRGPGSGRRLEAIAALSARKRRLPWEKKGLSRDDRMIAFLSWLPITKGPLAGKRMKLLPFQVEFIREIYGSLDAKGLRRRRIGIQSAPKGQGKSGLIAGICLAHLLGPEAENRGEVFSAAIDRAQAGIIFNEIEAVVETVPEFAVRTNCQRHQKRIEVLSGAGKGSTYEALSADARRAHGLAPTLFAYDELAQARDRILLDNLVNGLGKRKEGLGLIISTQAPSDDHALSQLIDDGLRGDDPSLFVQLLAAPPDADPFAESTWLACNPALGKFLSLQEMREAAFRARRMPGFEPSFRNLRLNQRVDANEEARIVTLGTWRRGNVPVDRAALAGRPCFGALDLSGKHDLTAFVLVFPTDDAVPLFDILAWFWTPQDQLGLRRPAEQERFRGWIEAGMMTATPGPTVRYDYVAGEIGALAGEFDIQAIAYDRWRIDDFRADLAKVDAEFPVPLEAFGQGFASMSPAIEFFAELALTGRLHHGGHPVLTASVVNAITINDPAGNVKLDKDKSAGRGPVRIDGAVALCMALGIAKRFQAAPRVNVDDLLANMVWA